MPTREEYERALAENRKGESELAMGRNFFGLGPQGGPPQAPPTATDAAPPPPQRPGVDPKQLAALLQAPGQNAQSTDAEIYAKYKAERDAPRAPRHLASLAGAVGGSHDIPLQSSLDAEHAQQQSDYTRHVAERDAGRVPQSLPGFLRTPEPKIPEGMMIGPNGGLIPKPGSPEEPTKIDPNAGKFASEPQQQASQTSGGGGYVAPHMGVTSRTIAKGTQFSDDVKRIPQEIEDLGRDANAMTYAADTQDRNQLRESEEAQNAYRRDARNEQRFNESQRGIQSASAEKKVGDKEKELAQTPATIPEYFSKQSSAGKVVNLIGLALGGIDLTGQKGGRNTFADGILDNIAAQMGKKREELDFASKGVKNLEGKHDKARLAEAQKMVDGLEAVRMEAHAQALKSGDPRIKANQNKADAALLEHILPAKEFIQVNGQDHVTEHQSLTGGSGGGGFQKIDNIFRDPSTGKSYAANDVGSRARLVAAATGNQDMKRMTGEYAALMQKLGTASRIGGKVGINTDDMTAAKNLQIAILARARELNHDGVWKKSETDLLEQTMSHPDKLFANKSGVQAKDLAHIVDLATQNAMSTEGIYEVQQGMGRNPKTGAIEPTARYTGEQYQAPTDASKGYTIK